MTDEAYKRRDMYESCTCGWSTWCLSEIDTLRARLTARDELLRELQRVVYAGIFGIPSEEAVRLRHAIQRVLQNESDVVTSDIDDAQETGD